MLSISEIVAKTEKMFDLFNDHFYACELARPAITVSPDGGRGAYGWCTVYEIWQANGQAYREINICAEYINRPISDVAATMLHEMAHLYNLTHGIKDVSNNGYYHNKKFKETAEAHGLEIGHHKKYGWTITSPSLQLLDFIERQGWTAIQMTEGSPWDSMTGTGTGSGTSNGKQPGAEKPTKKPSSTRKYICPCCKNSVRATKTVNIICGDCMEKMIVA